LTRKLGKVLHEVNPAKTTNPGYRLLRARGAENETRLTTEAQRTQRRRQERALEAASRAKRKIRMKSMSRKMIRRTSTSTIIKEPHWRSYSFS